eukprot:scaffold2366_cov115-Cylindrotheca_fusiformis.AAC.8
MKVYSFEILAYAAFVVYPRSAISFHPCSTRACQLLKNDCKNPICSSTSRRHCSGAFSGDEDSFDDSMFRRKFLAQVSSIVPMLAVAPSLSQARGLVQFPCTKPLYNTYHAMRAGQTLLEEEDILTTNPLFLTNREAALSDKGIVQVQEACQFLERNQINPSVIKYSLAASAMDTMSIVKEELKVGQNRIIPEFTFMDPRGIGQWDMMSYSQTLPAVIALDEQEAGKQGKEGRPPPNEDGTPNETLADQSIRLVQLLSVLETQFQGDTVLLVFPDGTSPALLSCLIAGIPLNKVHELEFAPGEVRLDLTMKNVRDFYEIRKQELALSDDYQATVEKGKLELQRLRSLKPNEIVSKKDMKIEKERLEIEEQQRLKDEERALREVREKQARLNRQKEVEARQEEKRKARMKEQQEAEVARLQRAGTSSNTPMAGDKTLPLALGGVASVAVVAALATESEEMKPATVKATNAATLDRNGTDVLATTTVDSALRDRNIKDSGVASKAEEGTKKDTTETITSIEETQMEQNLKDSPAQPETGLPSQLPEVSLPTTNAEPGGGLYSSQSGNLQNKEDEAAIAMQEYLDRDDGGEDWLKVMGQLMQEEDDDQAGTDGSDDTTS